MGAIGDHVPKYRHYKPKNLGVVRIDGRDHYLGKFGSPESYEKYHRLLAERYARGPGRLLSSSQEARPQSEVLTITELCVGYYRHCEKYYVKNGKTTNQVTHHQACRSRFSGASTGRPWPRISRRWRSRHAGPSSSARGSPAASATGGLG